MSDDLAILKAERGLKCLDWGDFDTDDLLDKLDGRKREAYHDRNSHYFTGRTNNNLWHAQIWDQYPRSMS